jgi:DNA polymerase III subunit beta
VMLEYAHPPLEVAFNVSYLLDVLSVMASKTIRLIFSSDSTHGLVIEPTETDENGIYVVMPLRL